MNGEISLVQPILGMMFVLIAMFGAFWVVKKLQNKANVFGGKTIQIVEAASVGTRERLVVAHVDGRKLLLGVTAQSINMLVELEMTDVDIDRSVPEKQKVDAGFQARLAESIKQIMPERKIKN